MNADSDKPRRGAGRTLPPEEARLFESAMRDARRLGRKASAAPAPEPPAAASPPARRTPPPDVQGQRLAPLAAGSAADIDRRTLDRLRRGRLRPEARIDLHGMTQEQAHRELAAFLARVQSEGRRCVLVVTGKGSVTAGGGVIRNAVPGWLNAPRLRPWILAFAGAAPRDGGSGALYVLLRRARRSP